MGAKIAEEWLQVRAYHGPGFMPLVAFDGWRVGILRKPAPDSVDPVSEMERHMKTDEVFVLTRGTAVLLLGGTGSDVVEARPQPMETGTIYNVRRGVWHAILLSRDASVLIVENRETGPHNSEFSNLTGQLRQFIGELARGAGL